MISGQGLQSYIETFIDKFANFVSDSSFYDLLKSLEKF